MDGVYERVALRTDFRETFICRSEAEIHKPVKGTHQRDTVEAVMQSTADVKGSQRQGEQSLEK